MEVGQDEAGVCSAVPRFQTFRGWALKQLSGGVTWGRRGGRVLLSPVGHSCLALPQGSCSPQERWAAMAQ